MLELRKCDLPKALLAGLGGLVCGLLFLAPEIAGAGSVVNPSAEDIVGGKPVGWGLYRGKGKARLCSSEDARSGQASACLVAEEFGEWRGRRFLNCGLVLGSPDGYNGVEAYPTQGGRVYQVSFWMKGDVPWVKAQTVCWRHEEATAQDRKQVTVLPGKLAPTGEWRRYSGSFVAPAGARRFALKWQVAGFAEEGMALGTLLVDDVEVIEMGNQKAAVAQRIRFPEKAHVSLFGKPIAEIKALFQKGNENIVQAVEGQLAAAERWVMKDDAWYLERTGKHTPLGMWTVACPFHPERVRDFSKDNFSWHIDDPWHLVCELCRAEGRELFRYPNERYPDDGTGCYPSDATWRADHDAAWTREHGGIPHDHWDGKAHGYNSRGYCYFFIGKCSHETMTFMAKSVLPQLAAAYVLAKEIEGADARGSAQYARKVKVAMLGLARAHLGDAYLAEVSKLSLEQFDDVVARFHGEAVSTDGQHRFPGYVPYDLFDGVRGDPKHPANRRTDVYGDGSHRGDTYARGWLRSYAFIRDSFTEEEDIVRRMVERLLVSAEGDEEALRRSRRKGRGSVKPGKLELAIEPYAMSVGSSNNLGGRELANQFDLGVLLGDTDIVDAVTENVRLYLRNYFNGDGLGCETSPAYTNCAWSSMSQIFSRIHGYKGHYGKDHPWWDSELGGLNHYRDIALREAVAKFAFCLFPDGTAIPWMDSHVGAKPAEAPIERALNEGDGLPKAFGEFYELTTDRGGVSARVRLDRLPSCLLHESRKAILRSGRGGERALLSMDYAPNTGHWHPAPMDLVLYAKGHELASDLGYFGAMHWLTKDWIRTCEAHNTCIIRNASGNHAFMHDVQGELRTLFVADGSVSAVEICERDPADLAHIPGADPFYQRTCVMVRVPTGSQGNEHYVLDIVRVRGGAWHDYYLHAQGRHCVVDGLTLETLPPGVSLQEASGFSSTEERPTGAGLIRKLEAAETDRALQVTWRDVPDFRGDAPTVDTGVGLRLTMLGGKGTRVYLGEAPGQRRMSNADLGETLRVLCARRPNGQAIDRFVAVLEPFRDEVFVRSVRELQVVEVPEGVDVVAVRVECPGQTDYVVSIAERGGGRNRAVRVPLDGGGSLETDGTLTVLTVRAGRPTGLTVAGGTHASAAGMEVALQPQPHGRLLAFSDRSKTLTVRPDGQWPVEDALHGRTLIIEHDLDTTTFTIDRIEEAVPGGDLVVHLKRTPRLYDNYLSVTQVMGNMLQVEPPPSLRHDFGSREYQVYRVSDGNEGQHIGEIAEGRQGTFTLATGTDGVNRGDLVGVTKLRNGRDRVTVPSFASVRLD
ncbi:MAG: hypothetical protein HN742_06030 [Lentisphaerae bacterium]|jgi:hypothetical protein|nr:hypothetical protein [Lentisphaerota bacterium]MBT5609643.1 hypothetical protein [Lentisphaerota bacterium]MBT7055243.1 hypothetical protein [Lentisphaerota bacterium]MBT7841409.1 hypothetical protein [Lentisphaerota bacterium]